VSARAIPIADDAIRLRAFLAFNNIELDFIAFFERFVPIQLNRRVVDEYIRPVFASDESVALGVVEPLDLSLVLSHRFLPSFSRSCFLLGHSGHSGEFPLIFVKTQEVCERLIHFGQIPQSETRTANFGRTIATDAWKNTEFLGAISCGGRP
jgi:hypothetical protein